MKPLLCIAFVALLSLQVRGNDIHTLLKEVKLAESFEEKSNTIYQIYELLFESEQLSENVLITLVNLTNEIKDEENKARFLILFSKYHFNRKEIDLSLEKAYEALNIIEVLDSPATTQLKTWVSLRLAIALKELGAAQEAIRFRKQQQQLLLKQNKVKVAAEINNYIGRLYLSFRSYDSAKVAFQHYLQFAQNEGNLDRVAFAQNNIGFTLLESGEFEAALLFFEKALEYYELGENSKANVMHGVVAFNIAECKLRVNAFNEAEEYNFKAGVLAAKANSLEYSSKYFLQKAQILWKRNKSESVKRYLDSALVYHDKLRVIENRHLENLMRIYELREEVFSYTKNYKKALNAAHLYKEVFLSLYGKKKTEELLLTQSHFQNLEIQNRMRLKMLELESQNRHIDELNAKNQIRSFQLVSVVLFGLLICMVSIYFLMKFKKKHLVDKLEKELLVLKSERQTERLTETSLTLARKREFAEDLKEKINDLEGINSSDKSSIKLFVDNELEIDNSLLEMDELVQELGEDFFTILQQKQPKLSENDLKLCGLIRMKLTTKQIAIIKSITPQSVKVSKNRLSKKMGLEKGTILYNYLKDI